MTVGAGGVGLSTVMIARALGARVVAVDRNPEALAAAAQLGAYRDLGPEWLAKRNEEAHTRRLVAQLEKLGHIVVIDPAA